MNIPKHIAIIPDGNRRWTKTKGISNPLEGHRVAFEEVLPELLQKAADLGIEYFTFWALSPENFKKRGKDEVSGLFALGKFFYANRLKEMMEKGVRIRFIGDLDKLSPDIQKIISDTTAKTKGNTRITLIIAVNYGGRNELMRAVQKVIKLNYLASNVNEDNFDQFLDTHGVTDPDLIIRTGGEQRLSGFMPWQSVYSEFYFSDVLFPDFHADELEKAVEEFGRRKRNFGK
jgi:undecaprenyl diphosphate synthase